MMPDTEVQVESITFGPDGVDLTWSVASEQSDYGDEGHFVRVPPAEYENEVMDLIESAQALLDAFLLRKRNPPARVPVPRR